MARKNKNPKDAYKPGDLVFVKVRGYSHWPAKIQKPVGSSANVRYAILFFGTHQTFEARTDAITPFNAESKKLYGTKCKTKSFAQAMWEIENDPELKFADEAQVETRVKMEPSAQTTSSSSESETSEDQQTAVEPEKLEKKPEASMTESVRSSRRLKSADQPTPSVAEKRKADPKPPVPNKRPKEDLDPIKEKLQKKEAWLKMTPEQRKEEVQRLKDSKTNSKRIQKIQEVKVQVALEKMAAEIESAVRLNTSKSLTTCEKILSDFVKLPVKVHHIHLVPQIVEAISKCKNQKESEKLKKSADQSQAKINSLLKMDSSENGLKAIEEMRKKYLEENKKDVERDRKLAEKLK